MTFDSFIPKVFFGGGVAVFISILFLIFALIVHLVNQKKKKDFTIFSEKMRPYLLQALFQDSVKLPSLSQKEKIIFFYLFNRFHDTLKGSSKEKLNQLAYQNQLDQFAITLFKKRSFQKKILAIWAFGHLKEKKMWDEMLNLLSHKDWYLSLAAAQTLMRIDSKKGISILIPFFIDRKDWPPDKVITLIKETESSEVDIALTQRLTEVPLDRLPFFLYCLQKIRSSSPEIRQILNSNSSPEVIIAVLPLLNSPADLPTIRYFLLNQNKEIQLEAIRALGRLGTEEDFSSLLPYLSDVEWQVRFEVAKTLANFSFVDLKKLKKIEREQTDPLAKEILCHVIAEKEFV